MRSEPSPSFHSMPVEFYFRAAFSIDIVLITFESGKLKILLQKNDAPPYFDEPGLPGKLILPNEDTNRALDKLALSLIGTCDFYKKQLNAFSEIDRHPLGRVISFAYYGLIPFNRLPQNLSERLSWHVIDEVPDLSYDHNNILSAILKRFRKGLLRHPRVFELLPEEFVLSEIISIYEQAFDKKLDASNFRKQLKSSELVKPLGKYRESTKQMGRPSELYTFNRAKYHGDIKDRVQFNF